MHSSQDKTRFLLMTRVRVLHGKWMSEMHSPVEDDNMQTHHVFSINHANTNIDARFAYRWLGSALGGCTFWFGCIV
jgi:hypothetical protein